MNYADIYRAEPGRRRECLYYLALGHYKMGNYDEARRFNGTSRPPGIARGYPITACRAHRAFLSPASRPAALLLDKEPSNLQAQSLASLIDTRVTRGTSLLRVVLVKCPLLTSRRSRTQRDTSAWRSSAASRRSARSRSPPSYGEPLANSSRTAIASDPRPSPAIRTALRTNGHGPLPAFTTAPAHNPPCLLTHELAVNVATIIA